MKRHLLWLAGVIFVLYSLRVNGEIQAQIYTDSAEHLALQRESQLEDGLLIYSNIAEYNWVGILDAFTQAYPWLDGKVETLDMGPSAVFERYYSERSVQQHTADFIVTAAPGAWRRFLDTDNALDYSSPLTAEVPSWSLPAKGLYTFSTDPMILIYNKILVKEGAQPNSLSDLVGWASQPDKANKLVTYNANSHSFAFAIHWAVNNALKKRGIDDQVISPLGSISRLENGGAIMVDKVMAGEYLASYFVSGITVLPKMGQVGRQKLLGWSLIQDGTPVFLRGMAITQHASSPASAKLLLNFLLSKQGQIAVGKGGLTPYRQDVSQLDVPYFTYADIEREIGEQNIIRVGYEPVSESQKEAFLLRWNALYRRNQ